jgi:flagellar protein FliL
MTGIGLTDSHLSVIRRKTVQILRSTVMMRWLCALIFAGISAAAFASGGGSNDPDPEGTKYFELFPSFVTNYQRDNGKLGFLSVGIQLKIKGATGVELVRQHLPLLQDAVVWLLRGQDETKVKDLAQREALRQQTLTELQTRLEAETQQKEIIQDVLFTKYVWQ